LSSFPSVSVHCLTPAATDETVTPQQFRCPTRPRFRAASRAQSSTHRPRLCCHSKVLARPPLLAFLYPQPQRRRHHADCSSHAWRCIWSCRASASQPNGSSCFSAPSVCSRRHLVLRTAGALIAAAPRAVRASSCHSYMRHAFNSHTLGSPNSSETASTPE